jgi:hypothetical protein
MVADAETNLNVGENQAGVKTQYPKMPRRIFCLGKVEYAGLGASLHEFVKHKV